MIRNWFIDKIKSALSYSPVVSLLGPRQCGKTTLARQFLEREVRDFPGKLNYFDLEDPLDLARLENPKLALETLQGIVVIDEIQRSPNLFPILRVLVDRPENPARFLILGSASRDLIRQGSETLAGRIAFIEVTPFALHELGASQIQQLWLRGGFPRSYLARTDDESSNWRKDFIRTFLERDVPSLGIQIDPQSLRRFWLMAAHYHGQLFNAAELGKSLQLSEKTVKRYFDVLTGTFLLRRLEPWFENIGKRQVKSPKIYFRDSGLFHHLLNVHSMAELQLHPKLGASWEGFAIEEVIRHHHAMEDEVFSWSVHQQCELDLLILKDGKKLGFEIKYADAPRLTSSMQKALELLHLDSLTVIFPGEARFQLADRIEVRGLVDWIGK